jgi:hypothetical protein
VPNCQAFPSIATQIPFISFFVCPNFFRLRRFFLYHLFFVFSSTNPAALNRTLKPKGASPRLASPRLSIVLLALHIDSWVLFYLNFLVCVLIYSPAPLILKWEYGNLFGAAAPVDTAGHLSLSLSVTQPTYSSNKMTLNEMKNRFTPITGPAGYIIYFQLYYDK